MEEQTAHEEECKLEEDMTGVVAAASTVFSANLLLCSTWLEDTVEM